ncbi:hypothetical protein ABW636_22195 [Aquimarina sp. 2201CG1-2-11]|uniref:hypothetical protein n=1 Tax=Aquimarina discodermiae TaxID=3231043 RepID=UPI00346248D8
MNEITLVINLFTLAIFFSLLLPQNQIQYFVNTHTISFSRNYRYIAVCIKKIENSIRIKRAVLWQSSSNTT